MLNCWRGCGEKGRERGGAGSRNVWFCYSTPPAPHCLRCKMWRELGGFRSCFFFPRRQCRPGKDKSCPSPSPLLSTDRSNTTLNLNVITPRLRSSMIQQGFFNWGRLLFVFPLALNALVRNGKEGGAGKARRGGDSQLLFLYPPSIP